MQKNKSLKKFQLLLSVSAVVSFSGCASYNSQSSKFISDWEAGNYVAAADAVEEKASKQEDNKKDGLVWNLERGAILRGAGDLDNSLASFEKAEGFVQAAEIEAKTKVSSEATALATNLTQIPYRGYFYDRIMLNTYQALNHIAMGDLDAARVELNRASQRQRDALNENAKRIEKAEAEARKVEDVQLEDGSSYVDKAKEDDGFNSNLDAVYQKDDGVAVYADYVNPFSVFIDGLYFLTNPAGPSDLERARKSFQRVAQMADSNRFAQDDLKVAEAAAASGTPLNDTTYVVFETGSAPYRKEIRIDIPVFLVSDDVPYVGAAFPRLVYQDDYLENLEVDLGSTTISPELVCSMDSVVKTEFYNELPIVITKTLVAAGTKALAAYAISEATDGNIFAQIATSAYQLAMNKADLRTWRSLPKEFHYCSFTTPEAGEIEVRNPISGESQSIQLESNNINVVYVRATGSTAPMSVHQFTMRPSRDVAHSGNRQAPFPVAVNVD